MSFCSLQTNIHSVSWLLWLSPTDRSRTLFTTSNSYCCSHVFTPQAIWQQKLQTLRFTSFHSYPKTLGYASLLDIFLRTARGIPTTLSKHAMHLCQHNSEDISTGGLSKQARLSLYFCRFIYTASLARRSRGWLKENPAAFLIHEMISRIKCNF